MALTVPESPWMRMKAGFLGVPRPSLMANPADFGGMHDADLFRRGFKPLTESREQVPVVRSMSVDLRSDHDVDIYATHPLGAADGEILLGGGYFSDPHPAHWRSEVHQAGELVIVVADPTPVATNQPDWLSTLIGKPIAILPLRVYAWDSGVGTRAPQG